MTSWHDKVEAAKHIVVAGAGIVGVEVAAELGHHQYNKRGDKKITLVGTFMPQVPALQGRCRSVLEQYKVHMMPGRTGEWHTGDTKVKVGEAEIDCDLLLTCTGKQCSVLFVLCVSAQRYSLTMTMVYLQVCSSAVE